MLGTYHSDQIYIPLGYCKFHKFHHFPWMQFQYDLHRSHLLALAQIPRRSQIVLLHMYPCQMQLHQALLQGLA